MFKFKLYMTKKYIYNISHFSVKKFKLCLSCYKVLCNHVYVCIRTTHIPTLNYSNSVISSSEQMSFRKLVRRSKLGKYNCNERQKFKHGNHSTLFSLRKSFNDIIVPILLSLTVDDSIKLSVENENSSILKVIPI